MSWKSLVTAGLFCVLASPAFAAPTLTIEKGGTFANGYLNANGDWVFNVKISNSNPIPTGSSPLAAELGFDENSSTLVDADPLNPFGPDANNATDADDNFDTVNPGTQIFGWELPGTGTNGKPEGVQTNCAAGCTVNSATAPNSVFAALGSADFGTVGPHDFIQIIIKGPSTGAGRSLTSTLVTSGAYGGKGRIAEATGATPPSTNYDTFSGTQVKTAKSGDLNLDGDVNGLDLAVFAENFGGSGKFWYLGDYTGEGDVNGLDLAQLAENFGFDGNPPGAGAGSGLSAGAAVPEPSTFALIGLAILGGLGVIRRKR
jgi:hypothetical protein